MEMVLLGQFLKTDGSGNLDFETVFSNIVLSDGTNTDTYNTNETLTFIGSGITTTFQTTKYR